MRGNGEYWKYVPDNCDPLKLSSDFLVILIPFVDPNLYENILGEYIMEFNGDNKTNGGIIIYEYNVIKAFI